MSTAPETEPDAVEPRAKPPFLKRVRIRNYKSIAFCDVSLEPLTILVGRNASGKSNFLDALAFLRDILKNGLAETLGRHGGVTPLWSRSAVENLISFELDASIPWDDASWDIRYSIDLNVPNRQRGYVQRERLQAFHSSIQEHVGFTNTQGAIAFDDPAKMGIDRALGQPFGDRPFLSRYASFPSMAFLYQLLSLATHNFNPEAMRVLRRPDYEWQLDRDGGNLACVLETTERGAPESFARIKQYLRAITGNIELLSSAVYGDYITARFRVGERETRRPLEFDAASMSDGTLRATAALVAGFQSIEESSSPSLVAIEEPETSLHPAATRALVDALDEATLRTQILLTTHSADMLDNPTIRPENIRVVEMIDGQTQIAPVDEASVEIVRRKLDTLGGLERQNQLQPNFDDLERQRHLSQNGQEPKP